MNDNSLERRAPEIVPVHVQQTTPDPRAAQQPHPHQTQGHQAQAQAHQAQAQPYAAQAPQPQFASAAGHTPSPYPYPQPAPQPSTDGLAIAAFVCGILGFALIPVVLGHISLQRIRRGERTGIGFAVVGLILGYIGIVLWVVAAITIAGSVIWAVNS